MIPQAIGMDFTEVNFALTDDVTRDADQERFRSIFTTIVEAGLTSEE
jgi:hypothetical protein